MMSAKPAPVLRICMLTLLQYLVPGVGLAILVFIASMFQTGTRAEFLRIASLGPLLALGAVGLARAIWIFVASRLDP